MAVRERFSLLLLEPGEIYFEDYIAFLYQSGEQSEEAEKRKIRGRLKICSKSIVFDPKDISHPILKFPLRHCINITECPVDLFRLSSWRNAIMVECTQVVEMMEGNVIAPYVFRRQEQKLVFSLNYGSIDDCVSQICQLHRASTLPAAEQNAMIAAIVFSRQSRVSFDTSWLEDLYETLVLEIQCSRITPLVTNPGRLLLTSSKLYFQPYNNVELYPVLKIKLSDVKRIIKRRFLLRQVGLEIFCDERATVPHIYLSLKNAAGRDNLYDCLLEQVDPSLKETGQEHMTLQWQNGVISNYDYLTYLNSLADRSFSDLTQYPVFPWVVSDYSSSTLDLDNPHSYRDLSKPVGALNKVRLERLQERFQDMPEPRFLYGSHYSTPGFVLYYLVRKFPEYMLCLQNGRFDHPDRMFNSVPDTWKNVTTNGSDFKELIPEFYATAIGGDFLVNTLGLDYGVRQDGTKIGDVELPPWASSPAEFVSKLQIALESEFVSRSLHMWIDLIFGYKQRGKEAEAADNLFYHLCYEGGVDLDSIRDLNERHALEVQIMEFGQIPKQLFTSPHPQRIRGLPPFIPNHVNNTKEKETQTENDQDVIRERVSSLRQQAMWRNMESLSVHLELHSHKEPVTAVCLSQEENYVFSVSRDSLLKMYSIEEKRQLRSVNISNMALSCCVLMPDEKNVIVGSWDNSIAVYSIEYGKVVNCVQGHDDAVSCMCWNKGLLVTGSWDTVAKVWSCLPENQHHMKITSSLQAELDHESHVTSVALNSDSTMLITGTQDGEVFMWELITNTVMQQLPSHSGAVHAVNFSPDSQKVASCGEDHFLRVMDLDTGTLVYAKDTGEELRCLAWDGLTVLLGGSSGDLLVWDLVTVRLTCKIPAHTGPVTTIAVSTDGKLVVTGGEDRRVVVWKTQC